MNTLVLSIDYNYINDNVDNFFNFIKTVFYRYKITVTKSIIKKETVFFLIQE